MLAGLYGFAQISVLDAIAIAWIALPFWLLPTHSLFGRNRADRATLNAFWRPVTSDNCSGLTSFPLMFA